LIARAIAATLDGVHTKAALPILSNLRIASPCPEDWAGMDGDEKQRRCARCDRTVYNLSAMTDVEVEALASAQSAAWCARYYERADGMIMTSNCTDGRTRRVVEGTVVAVVLAAAGFTVWQQMGTTVRSGGVGYRDAVQDGAPDELP
jgi:hypothetical protein